MLDIKFGFDWPSGLRGDDVCLNTMVMYMYCPGVGADEPQGSNFFQNH